jgi:hypothetical protein
MRESAMPDNVVRYRLVAWMRLHGLTFREIGEWHGISYQRASQLYLSWQESSKFREARNASDLYLDPSDLSKKVSLLTGPGTRVACPFCGCLEWHLTDEVLDVALIPQSWKWACFER